MLRVIIPIAVAIAIIIGCVIYLADGPNINNGTEDILYNGIVYERAEMPSYNLELSEKNTTYIGDFVETYAYGQEFPYEVYTINSEENLLSSAHAVWIKPGYQFPEEFGEDFASLEYVVSEGLDFFMIEDDYTEVATLLAVFEESVKLEDIVESEPTDLSEFVSHDTIRLTYKDHKDMFLLFTLCSHDGKYYLNILKEGEDGPIDCLHEIKPEYLSLLTSRIPKK